MSYCDWGNTSIVNKKYHDVEWGIPVHNDGVLFEYLLLEVMQCGLNWNIVINKRDVFRKCFDNFNYESVSEFNENDVERIMLMPGMIRSRRKIEAMINNAKCILRIKEEFGSFSNYLWSFSDNKTIIYDKHCDGFIPVSNGLSDVVSKDLKKRGLKFIGTINIYSYLQAVGIINDHGNDCPRYQYIVTTYPCVKKKRYNDCKVFKF